MIKLAHRTLAANKWNCQRPFLGPIVVGEIRRTTACLVVQVLTILQNLSAVLVRSLSIPRTGLW